MSATSNNGDKVSNSTFAMFKELVDTKFQTVEEHFAKAHDCDKRIEEKVDNLIEKLEKEKTTKQEHSFGMKLALFTGLVGVPCTLLGVVLLVLLKLPVGGH